jgi:uncharacterized protein (TIGR02001 family)
MNVQRMFLARAGLLLFVCVCAVGAEAHDKPEVSVNVDVVSRYIWRGLNPADAPSLQPSIVFGYRGCEVGTWGAYSLSNNITESDEIDFWLGYTHDLDGGTSLGLVLTDYYYPNAGPRFSNFNNYDDKDGPGAHTFEVGASLTLSDAIPLTVSGYANVYNDEGHNAYFQLDYPLTVGEADLNFFVGATPGSNKNPDYYGTDAFKFLNVGVSATKEVKVSETFSLPVTGSFIVNPNLDMAYLVIGFSL